MSTTSVKASQRPITVPDYVEAKRAGRRLTLLTAYDYTFARLADQAELDGILVGDSLGMVIKGQSHSLEVTLDEVIYHTRCVARGVERALLIADLPFMTYQVGPAQALRSAGRLIQEGAAQAVKLEGGERSAAAVQRIVAAGIPVMGHVGMTPQSVHQYGGFRVQREQDRILADARAIAKAGAFAMVLECIPSDLAATITREVGIPTIGIGAGSDCDGQILVLQDMLGLFDKVMPKFVKQYAQLGEQVRQAITTYRDEVTAGTFPGPEHGYRG